MSRTTPKTGIFNRKSSSSSIFLLRLSSIRHISFSSTCHVFPTSSWSAWSSCGVGTDINWEECNGYVKEPFTTIFKWWRLVDWVCFWRDFDAEFKATYREFQSHDSVIACGSLLLLRMIGRNERIWPETSYGESGSAISSNGAQLRSSEPDLRSVHCRIASATLLWLTETKVANSDPNLKTSSPERPAWIRGFARSQLSPPMEKHRMRSRRSWLLL